MYKVIPQEGTGADQEMQSLVKLGEDHGFLISAECMEGNSCSRVRSDRPL